jgi:hypothetical protein
MFLKVNMQNSVYIMDKRMFVLNAYLSIYDISPICLKLYIVKNYFCGISSFLNLKNKDRNTCQ